MEKLEVVLYLCDRKQCDPCNPECSHTSFVEHAVNFRSAIGGYFVEIEEGRRCQSSKCEQQ